MLAFSLSIMKWVQAFVTPSGYFVLTLKIGLINTFFALFLIYAIDPSPILFISISIIQGAYSIIFVIFPFTLVAGAI